MFGKAKIDVGIDLNNSRLTQIKSEKIYKRVIFYDGHKLPFKNDYFGSIVSNCVLEHIDNLPEAINEISRVIKPGGYFVTSVMTNKWEDYLFFTNIFGDFYKKFLKKTQQHNNLLSAKDWITIFKKNGFEVISTQGYLSPKTCKLIDLYHYLSFPSLVTYVILKKWVVWKDWYKLFSLDKLVFKQLDDVLLDYKESAAIFFVLRKSSLVDDHKP